MTRFRKDPACEQARAWAALAPDGELTEFESASFRAHTATCPSCESFALQVDRIVRLVRAAEPLVPDARVSVRTRTTLPRRAAARARPVVAVAAVALMAVGVASRAPLPVDPREQLTLTISSSVSTEADRRELHELRNQPVNLFATSIRVAPMPAVASPRAV
ncbi:MAG TPA: zf-HC2 domain-containing protein [Gaiellaceae bacterium]|nr:zf-HC2 domain-containing protein [Gaiellaceae bacterium]